MSSGVLSDRAVPTWNGALLTEDWYWTGWLASIGRGGLAIADVDADGEREIIHTGENGRWYVWSCHQGSCRQEYASRTTGHAITAMAIAQTDGDLQLEVVLGSEATVAIFDGATHQLERTFETGVSAIEGLAVADIDADGSLELVVCDLESTLAYDLTTGGLERSYLDRGGADLAVGQIDGDLPLEVALAGVIGEPVVALDGESFEVQWQDPAYGGAIVRLADTDNDTVDELFAVSPRRAWDLTDQQLLWQIDGNGPIDVGDVDGDGTLETVHLALYAIVISDASTGAGEWSMGWSAEPANRFAIGGIGLAASPAIVFGTASELVVVGGTSHTTEWRRRDANGPYFGLDRADVDGDGRAELLVTTNPMWGNLMILNEETREVEYERSIGLGFSSDGLDRVRAVNLDDDVRPEVCFTTEGYPKGGISCIDGLTHEPQWEIAVPEAVYFCSLESGDLDGDGLSEIIAGAGPYVFAFEGRTGWLRWRSPDLGFGHACGTLLRVAELDGDASPEVVVATNRADGFAILDGATGAPQLPRTPLHVSSLAPRDLDGDGVEELAVGLWGGEIAVIDPLTGTVQSTLDLDFGPVHGLTAKDLTGDRVSDWVFAARDHLYVLDGATLDLLADSGPLSGSWEYVVADNDSLLTGDFDADGRLEVLANVVHGLQMFEVLTSSLFKDDFEGGDLVAWAESQP